MYPSDVILPANAKYYGFIDTKMPFNSHWDITWSFSFALTGTEHGFTTFLTTYKSLTGGIPGTRLGYLGNKQYSLSSDGTIALDLSGNRLPTTTPVSSYNTMGCLAVAFDTTGLFALSSTTFDGVPLELIKRNSIIVRDCNDKLVYYQELSALDSTFFLSDSSKSYQTLRFRLLNAGRLLHIDKQASDFTFNNITTVILSSFNADTFPTVYTGFTFCSPVSSLNDPSTLFIKNYHTQGSNVTPTYETVSYDSIYPTVSTTYSTISGIL